MEIIETTVFTRQVQSLFDELTYRALQLHLVQRPDAGVLIPRGRGLRKLRWATPGSGKRGGARVIYYWATEDEKILMLFACSKSRASDLTPAQVRQLAALIREDFP